jgi:hypothetical protein
MRWTGLSPKEVVGETVAPIFETIFHQGDSYRPVVITTAVQAECVVIAIGGMAVSPVPPVDAANAAPA